MFHLRIGVLQVGHDRGEGGEEDDRVQGDAEEAGQQAEHGQDVWLRHMDVQIPQWEERDGQQDEEQRQHKVDLVLRLSDVGENPHAELSEDLLQDSEKGNQSKLQSSVSSWQSEAHH